MTVDFGVFRWMSVGNRVWFDINNDALISGGESGIPGVTVELWQDNGDGVFDPTTDTLVGTEITNAQGYYLFDRLLPGNYFVNLPISNFGGAGALVGMNSSNDAAIPGPAGDNNDNGIGSAGPGPNGINSPIVNLVENAAPTTETDFSGDAITDGPRFIGVNGENNQNADVSIDFGFNTSSLLSVGNRVWLDDGTGGGVAGDGLRNGTEPGIPGVTVRIYAKPPTRTATIASITCRRATT
jgi:hypothetical protein